MKTATNICLFVWALSVALLHAQSPVQEAWVRHYSGGLALASETVAMVVDQSGNIYVAGWSEGAGETGHDYVTLKYNRAGVQQWVARYNSAEKSHDEAVAIAVDAAGNVYVTGVSPSASTGKDYLTLKYNSAGGQEWDRRYNGPGNADDRAVALAVDAAGNLYVTGVSKGSNTGDDYATIKYNSAGMQEWVLRYNGPANADDQAAALAIDPAGDIYVTGTSPGVGTGADYTTIKYNSAGAVQWMDRYNGPGNGLDAASALTIDRAGQVYVTGASEGAGTDSDFTTIKYTTVGRQEWVVRYNDSARLDPAVLHGSEAATSVVVDSSGNVYVGGKIISPPLGTLGGLALIKYNSAGAELWRQSFSGSNQYPIVLAVDFSENVYALTKYTITFSGVYSSLTKYNRAGTRQWSVDHKYMNALAVDPTSAEGIVCVTGLSYNTIKYNADGSEAWKVYYYERSTALGNDDQAFAIAVDAAGNAYVAGKSWFTSAPSRIGPPVRLYDYATVKYGADGVQQWVAGNDCSGSGVTDLAVDAAGNVYVTGTCDGDYLTIKYNSAGAGQWVARYDGLNNGSDSFARAIAIDDSGNVYVTGESLAAYNDYDYVTIKYNRDGVQAWAARYGHVPGQGWNDRATALSVDDSGNVYVTGQSYGGDTQNDYATIKYNRTGVVQWFHRYNSSGNGSDMATALAIDDSGNVYVTGWSLVSGASADYATIKYNAAGVEQWIAGYNGPVNSSDQPRALAVNGSGEVYVTGNTATIKYNRAGVQQWLAAGGNDLTLDAAGQVYVTGLASFTTRKYSSAGIQEWTASHNSNEVSTALAIDGRGNVYVTGYSTVFTTIKYVQNPVAVEERENSVPGEFGLAPNYPNPFSLHGRGTFSNPSTTIRFNLPATAQVTLNIYNMLGQKVRTLTAGRFEAGYHQIMWDGRDDLGKLTSSGVYFLQMYASAKNTNAEFVRTRKLVLME